MSETNQPQPLPSLQHKEAVESGHEVPSAIPTLEARFRGPDGQLDHLALQRHLQSIEAKGAATTLAEIQEAIQCVRLLRRTNTGPAAATKTKKAKKGSADFDLNELFTSLPDGN